MKIPRFRIVLLAAALVAPLGGAGCMPFSMGIFTPIPVPPWAYERMQDKYVNEKIDKRTVIMPPIRDGFPPPICEDPPDDAQVLRALEQVVRGVPYVYEEFRDDIQIITERMVDRIDPVRTYPLVGDCQLHHCHYKCTVYFTETISSGYPFPTYIKRARVEVVYIDKDHLHLAVQGGPQVQTQVATDLLPPR
jgi:hypothetical protein